VGVGGGGPIRGKDGRAIGSVRVDDFPPMIDFLKDHELMGEQVPQASDVCVPLGQ